ncbi:MAG TPA: hypothetical protein VK203_16825 [Nostocaceae cyanobacterium]|nr:hypothetical protein [Nostocaceae cyanobacterium]
MKFTSKLFCAMIGLTIFSATATQAQAQTVTNVVIKNQLQSPILLVPSSVNILGTATPGVPLSILANNTNINPTFTVRSPFTNIASIHFSYSAGTRQCRFSTSLTTTPTIFGSLIPSWTKSGTSTGSTFANCEAKITVANPNTPFNYTVEFTMR